MSNYDKVINLMDQMEEYALETLRTHVTQQLEITKFLDGVLENVQGGDFSTDLESLWQRVNNPSTDSGALSYSENAVDISEKKLEITKCLDGVLENVQGGDISADFESLWQRVNNPSTHLGALSCSENTVGKTEENKMERPRRTKRNLRSRQYEPLQNIDSSVNAKANQKTLVPMKLERLIEHQEQPDSSNILSESEIKKEHNDRPPPSVGPRKRGRQTKKQKTSQMQVKEKPADGNVVRDSDVVLQVENVEVINLNSDEEEDKANPAKKRTRTKVKVKTELEVPVTRSTRTRALARKLEENILQNSVDDEAENKNNKEAQNELLPKESEKESLKRVRNSSQEKHVKSPTNKRSKLELIKDAPVDSTININNEKFVAANNEPLDTTVTIPQPQVLNNIEIGTISDVITEDEDKSFTPPSNAKLGVTKAVFNPYDTRTIKQKVEFFEKLTTPTAPTRTVHTPHSRIGGKLLKKQASFSNTPGSGRGTTLFSTPLQKQLLTTKSNCKSALEVSQKEYQERELRSRNKVAVASAKKDALLHAQTEEKRKKREERELRVQQVREALSKDRSKVLENAELLKREKMKQAAAEKEEKLARKREEAAAKQAIAIKKAMEEKRKQVGTPLYLKQQAPLLPTTNCYDSDDEAKNQEFEVPLWQRQVRARVILPKIREILKSEILNFYGGPQAIDLRTVFSRIKPDKVRRTSSAIWDQTISMLDDRADSV